ncbi:MAG: GntR family transcriptional regulator [Rhodospirillaceae bacterium]|jgi:DNA-binding GntR family transcriptional regulator|nr:GntR family transcriptional regulator [Rhodospirillaceae bacterium]|tara:strand:+ start:693 stop:1466 length:774 start_codon:yes stop_codon:yes gene_type:complete
MNGAEQPRSSKSSSRYVQLSDILIKEIAGGQYPIGSRLPTEHELCDQYNISRHTVREALRRLKELGLVSRRQGSGTVVESLAPPATYVQSIQSLEDIVQHAHEAKLSVITTETVEADQWLSQQLGCQWGDRWLRIEGVRRVGGQPEPISWTEIYVRNDYSGVKQFIKNAPRAISALIQQHYDEPITEVKQRISAVGTPDHIAKLLKVPPGSPALSIIRQYRNNAGEVILLSLSMHPGERYIYSMSINKVKNSFKIGD